MKSQLLPVIGFCSIALLSACSDNDNNRAVAVLAEPMLFNIEVTNLTYSQPFSPVALVIHSEGYRAFTINEAASLGLENLAESGNPAEFLTEAAAATEHVVSVEGSGVPQRSIANVGQLEVPVDSTGSLLFTAMTMLIDTNDAFTGINAVDISDMAVGESRTLTAISWDAGTEANTETAATVPGPAAQAAGGGGVSAGFDATRDDINDAVHVHPGVVSNANASDASFEGLATSVLSEGDRWDNPTARFVISRTQ